MLRMVLHLREERLLPTMRLEPLRTTSREYCIHIPQPSHAFGVLLRQTSASHIVDVWGLFCNCLLASSCSLLSTRGCHLRHHLAHLAPSFVSGPSSNHTPVISSTHLLALSWPKRSLPQRRRRLLVRSAKSALTVSQKLRRALKREFEEARDLGKPPLDTCVSQTTCSSC